MAERPAGVELPGTSATESFGSLYERSFERVYAYAASLLRDRAAAEDVTAQAFERAYRKRRRYRASRGTPEAWLFGIVRNAALDELRRRKRRAPLQVEPRASTRPRRTSPITPCGARPSEVRWRVSPRPNATSWRSSSPPA